jgi:organic hydroperoxide reductase OsmC/OhrA
MTENGHIGLKKDNPVLFEIRLDWLGHDTGIITSNEVKDTVHVALPPAFGGLENQWSPEHLFLGSIASCYMTTLGVIANRMRLEMIHFNCQIIGHIQLVDGKYEFTAVDLYPKVFIRDESYREKAEVAMQKTKKHCLVANSIRTSLIYHPEILIESHPGLHNDNRLRPKAPLPN